MTVSLVGFAIYMLSLVSNVVAIFFTLIVFFVTFIGPMWFISLQRYKK